MAASTEDMINQLQMGLAQPPQQNFLGVSAPPDLTKMQALLQQLKQQQFLQQASAPTPGPYGYLHDAGKQQFLNVGQQLGTAAGQALTMPDPNAAPTPQAAATAGANQAIAQAKAAYTAQVANGVDEGTARQNAAKMLVAAGLPGAADALAKANVSQLDNNFKVAETAKDTSQGQMDQANIANQADEAKNRAFTQGSGTWKTTYTDPNGLFEIQTNANGENKRVELKPPPSAAAQAAANMDPSSIQFAADTYRTTGKFPGSFGRSPAMQQAVLAQVAKDALANGDTAGAIAARSASLKAGGTALDATTKQEAFTTGAVQTLDKNLTALQTIGSKLDDSGSPIINKVVNHFNQGVTSDPTTASYVAMLNAVQGEYAKIASNNNGNSPVSDSAKADAKDVINKAMSQGGIAGVAAAMRQESANRLQAIRDTKNMQIQNLSVNAPGAQQGTPAPVAAATAAPVAPPAPVLNYNPKTGKFE